MIWTILWIVLAAIPIVGFVVLEDITLHLEDKGHTCSATARRILRTDTKRGRTLWVLIMGVCMLLEVWLFAHILGVGEVWWP